MSSAPVTDVVTGVDFVSIPTRDLERSVAFYGQTLGLERSAYRPDRNHAEFETGTVTLNVLDPERMGIGSFTPNANVIALHWSAFPIRYFVGFVSHTFSSNSYPRGSCCFSSARTKGSRPTVSG